VSKSNAGFGSTDWFLGFGLSVAGGGELVMESRESPIVSVAANQAHLKFTRGHGVATPVQTEPTSSKISAAALGPHTGRAPPDPILPECRWSASVVFSKTLTRRPPTNHQPRPPGSFLHAVIIFGHRPTTAVSTTRQLQNAHQQQYFRDGDV